MGGEGKMEQKKTFYQEFEVFSKRTPSSPFQHQFSLLAPNAEMAIVMAQENFMRREPVADIWVINREHIKGLSSEEKVILKRLDNKDYRTTKGYGYLKKKWRHYEQQMFDEKEILSWAGGNEK
jgi:ring-1,2-phenylacetyl-CoA epoxidase subunit PaaB